MHAVAYLKDPAGHKTGPVIVLSGKVRHLKQAALRALAETVLGPDDDGIGLARFAGENADLKSVCDELLTVSMWGDRRMVVVEDADDFVSQNRAGLEKYLDRPAKKSVLVLDVKSWPKNTRLAKMVAKIGLPLECAELKTGELVRWLADESRSKYGKQLSRDAARLMVELAGNELGLLDQELGKLSAYVGDRPRIDAEDVRSLVGGWKAETTWAMTGAIRDGNLGLAMTCLDKLLTAGEAPQRVLGGINFVFRKYAQATELARQGTPLPAALQQAGVFPRDVSASAAYLRRIGRPRAEQLYQRLLTADRNLKGSSRLPPRLQLEHLLVGLSGKL
jgi:DNA polymerase-3 subunit delta